MCADRQDGRCDGSIEHRVRRPLYYSHPGWVWSTLANIFALTFFICVSATEALVQDVLFSSPGSVTTIAFVFF